MSILVCRSCSDNWDATQSPTCPECQTRFWAQSTSLIKAKHDPTLLPSACNRFRTVVSYELVASPVTHLKHAVLSGSWFYEQRHNKWFHYSIEPLGLSSGSAINAGNPMPHTSYDGLIIADADQSPHIFAEDSVVINYKRQNGVAIPLQSCSTLGCNNLCVPRYNKCAKHCQPPLAD